MPRTARHRRLIALAADIGLPATLALLTILATLSPARSHHVGAYAPRDNEVSANFKQIKFSLQAQKFEVALRLYEHGALRRELRRQAQALPRDLDASLHAAIATGDQQRAETGLMIFFAALARDLAVEGDRQLADPETPPAMRVAAGSRILEALWRYYNLVDFAVSQREPKAAAAVRLAVDDAEGYAKARPPMPERMRPPLTQIARVLTGVIDASSPTASTRRTP
jgi:hypothetical protein